MTDSKKLIHNETTGETIKFLLTAADTNGELLQFEDTLPPDHPGVPPHIHAAQEETFTVLDGTFQATVDGEEKVLTQGESITIPAGVAHSFHTKQGEGVTVLVELRPALEYETFFETLAVAESQKRILPLQVALLTRELNLGFYLAGIPRPIQSVMFTIMASVARVLGYRSSY